MLLSLNINPIEKRTFNYHLAYSILEGIVYGVFALNEFIFLKSLHGSNYMLGFLFQFSMVVLIPTVFINEILRRTINKKTLLIYVAIFTRAPLVLLLFFPNTPAEYMSGNFYHLLFLGIFLNYYLASTMIYPSINLFLKSSYQHNNFGKLYGYASSANKITTMLATFIFGLLLDFDNYAFTYIYPFIAIIGIASVFLFTRIHYKQPDALNVSVSIMNGITKSAKNFINILRKNKPYSDFEVGFMLYGFAFMITVSVITIFLDRELHLNYSGLAFYKNGNVTLTIILLPIFGKLLGNIDPRRFAIYTFGSLVLYIFFVALTKYFPLKFEFLGIQIYYFLVLAYIFFALFAASMGLLWSIGSAYFCKDEDAGEYQSIHLSLTGVRASFAPLLGILFYESFGFTITFLIGIISLLIGMWYMHWSIKNR